jgi:hypothetical protein
MKKSGAKVVKAGTERYAELTDSPSIRPLDEQHVVNAQAGVWTGERSLFWKQSRC